MINPAYVIVGVPERQQNVKVLEGHLKASNVSYVVSITPTGKGASYGHTEAYKRVQEAYSEATHYIFIEDDAILSKDFANNVMKWLKKYPEQLISFYLGTSRPPQYQNDIIKKLQGSPELITLQKLIHGVCYAIPSQNASQAFSNARINHPPIDFQLGNLWKFYTGKDIIYTNPSLVDHLDETPIEQHADGIKRTQPRKAHHFIDLPNLPNTGI